MFKEWRVMNNVDSYFRYYTQTFFVTRLIINKINKVQWVDFKLENVIVSLHSFKTMGLRPFGASAPLFLRNGELLGHSPIPSDRKTFEVITSTITHSIKKKAVGPYIEKTVNIQKRKITNKAQVTETIGQSCACSNGRVNFVSFFRRKS